MGELRFGSYHSISSSTSYSTVSFPNARPSPISKSRALPNPAEGCQKRSSAYFMVMFSISFTCSRLSSVAHETRLRFFAAESLDVSGFSALD